MTEKIWHTFICCIMGLSTIILIYSLIIGQGTWKNSFNLRSSIIKGN